MHHSWRNWFSLALLLAALFIPRSAAATIDYSVSIAHPEKHVFGISVRIPNVHDRLIIQMPAWNATYQIRDFAAHMMQISAQSELHAQLPLEKLDKQTWQVRGEGTVTIEYSILWDEPGPFSTQLNPDHAFLNLAMLLVYVPDRRGEDTRIAFDDVPENWRVAVELEAAGMSAGRRTGAYTAPTYDALVDAPVEIGAFEEISIEAGGRHIRIAIHGDAGDRTRLTDALKRIVDYQVTLMDGAPFREFLFIFHVGTMFGGGGMEHASSTAIAADIPAQLPSYSAHEFFHTWNVKRIRPQSLEPVDYTREMFTRALWFAEGVTNTYGAYTLVRTNLWTTQQYYGNLAAQITELEARPAHRWQSAEQSSLDAWFEKYPIYTRAEESVSYYNKGELLGVALDLLIRDATDNRSSLDDVMRYLNEEYARRGRFYNERDDLRAAVATMIQRGSPGAKVDLNDFFARYVSGAEEIPFAELLGRAGWLIKDTSQHRAALGFELSRENGGGMTVRAIEPRGPAELAGLLAGDVVVAINGENVPRSPDRWLRDHQPDEHITVKVRRRGEEREIRFALGRQYEAVYQITESPEATEKQVRIRNGILHGVVDTPR